MVAKLSKLSITIICVVVIAALIVAAAIGVPLYLLYHPKGDTEARFIEAVDSIDFLENDLDSALPQTEIYNIVQRHFASELPEGKTIKKAIVIGYDGCRLDVLTEATANNGAIRTLLDEGGKAYISYCGGRQYPEKNTQDTSTAPGWCSMLTGKWADVHGVTGNGIVKTNDNLTALTTLVEDKTINQSAFYVSWKGHFVNKKSTYKSEAEYIREHNLNVVFDCSKNDDGTKTATLADLQLAECSDFIFTIFEQCDHAGHKSGYFTEKESYKKAFAESDSYALEVIDKIKARSEYAREDWLILITSDHGGINRNHGSSSIQERETFIIANKNVA